MKIETRVIAAVLITLFMIGGMVVIILTFLPLPQYEYTTITGKVTDISFGGGLNHYTFLTINNTKVYIIHGFYLDFEIGKSYIIHLKRLQEGHIYYLVDYEEVGR